MKEIKRLDKLIDFLLKWHLAPVNMTINFYLPESEYNERLEPLNALASTGVQSATIPTWNGQLECGRICYRAFTFNYINIGV